jgi:hypothetical protein
LPQHSSQKIETGFGYAFKSVPEPDPGNTSIKYYLIEFLGKSQEIFLLSQSGFWAAVNPGSRNRRKNRRVTKSGEISENLLSGRRKSIIVPGGLP